MKQSNAPFLQSHFIVFTLMLTVLSYLSDMYYCLAGYCAICNDYNLETKPLVVFSPLWLLLALCCFPLSLSLPVNIYKMSKSK